MKISFQWHFKICYEIKNGCVWKYRLSDTLKQYDIFTHIHFYFIIVYLPDFRSRLYEAWIAYPADKSKKYNSSAIHTLNKGTYILIIIFGIYTRCQ